MDTQLLGIFDIRAALFRRCNLKFYKQHEQDVINSSLAAQDFCLSGDLDGFDPNAMTSPQMFLYAQLHADYFVPYKYMETGLVFDLAMALQSDIKSGLLGPDGKIVKPELLSSSNVLRVYHESEDSGIPVTALNRMKPQTRATFIQTYCKTKKR